jgi:MurNAc alpha-1-phosphate uridylyltransferase
MTAAKPTHAMVLAAGLGLRMRPLTETKPKPLIEVAGATMLDRALDRLVAAGVETAVVNTHWLPEQVEAAAARRKAPAIEISREDVLLETGGGIAKALPKLGAEAFYAINADIVWRDGAIPALDRLAAAWRDGDMDGLLLLQSTVRATGYSGDGDFLMDSMGRIARRPERVIAPFVFTGIQILHPRLFEGATVEPFSLNRLYDAAIERERLFGVAHDGDWFHVGTPHAIAEAEAEILESEGSRVRRLF